jgi:hypothetical protein
MQDFVVGFPSKCARFAYPSPMDRVGPCKESYQRLAREMICKLTPELRDRPGGDQLGETGQKALQTARVRAVRTVAIALAPRSPRCFGGRVARRRLAARHSMRTERRSD